MIRVKDQDGNVVPGILKDVLGNLVVNDVAEYNKYKREKDSAEQINELKSEVDQLKQLVHALLREKNG